MRDRTRMEFAALCSAVLHLLLLAAIAYGPHGGPAALASTGEPIVLQLQPSAPEPSKEVTRSLVAPGMPTSEPVHSSDTISTQNSKASDLSNSTSDGHAPAVDHVDGFDSPGGGTPLMAAPRPAQTPSDPAREERKLAKSKPQDESPKTADNGLQAVAKSAKPATQDSKEKSPAKEKAEEKPKENMKLAQAETPPVPAAPPSVAPAAGPGPSHGRVQGGVKTKGFLGFEAEKNEFAPYLQEVQRKVEARWRATLQMRYSGVSQTQAIVDCSIGPDGKLVSVQIVDPGNSVSFAPLCKDSIEKAGPFSPFPFTVPDAYRSKNLEIRWTFNFM